MSGITPWIIIAVLILGGIAYSNSDIVKDIGAKTTSVVKNIPTLSKTSCESKAKELVPRYVVLSDSGFSQIPNYWKNKREFSLNNEYPQVCFGRICLRDGNVEGENINYLYLTNKDCCPSSIDYSEKIIKDDIILGTTSFSIVPVFKEVDLGFKPNIEVIDKQLVIQWTGFTTDIKELFYTEDITIQITRMGYNGKETLYNETFTEEENKTTFEGLRNMDKTVYQKGYALGLDNGLHITPDIFNNKIYEIVRYNIISCNWIQL